MQELLLGETTLSRADSARLRLLEAGVKCFARGGVEGVSIREIAQEAGQNSAAIKYYFESKDGLYQAVLAAVMRFVKFQAGSVFDDYHQAIKNNEFTRDLAKEMLLALHRNALLGILSSNIATQFAVLLVREQTQPTSAFDDLFQHGMEPLHKMVSHLVSKITGDEFESEQSILRAHAVIGQMQVFVMARETILRRLNWKDFDDGRALRTVEVMQSDLKQLIASWERQSSNKAAPANQSKRTKSSCQPSS